MKRFVVLLVLAWFTVLCGEAFAATLQELEGKVDSGLNALEALAQVEEFEARRDVVRESGGPRLFASVGYTGAREPVTTGSSETIHYEHDFQTVGLKFPLVGEWAQRRIAELDAQAGTAEARHRAVMVRGANTTALRKAWIIRWMEKQKRVILQRYIVEAERDENILRSRLADQMIMPGVFQSIADRKTRAGHLLARSNALEKQAANVMYKATGVRVPLSDIHEPDLPALPLEKPSIEDSEEIRHLDEAVKHLEAKKPYTKWTDLNVSLETSLVTGRDHPGSSSHAGQVGLLVEVPLNFLGSADSRARAASASVSRARRAFELRREYLGQRLEDSLAAFEASREELAYYADSLKTARTLFDATLKRSRDIEEVGVEDVALARAEYLQAKLDALDCLNNRMQMLADVLDIAARSDGEGGSQARVRLSADARAAGLLKMLGASGVKKK